MLAPSFCDLQPNSLNLVLGKNVALLKIDGKTVRKVAQAEVGGLAEGITFSPDGHFLYVGNFVDGDIDILRLEGDALTKIGSLALSGHPASMRGNTP